MHLRVVQRILGVLLMLYSMTMLVPAAVSMHFEDGQASAFMDSFGIILVTGLVIWLPAWRERRDLRVRDGFLVAAVFWLGLGTFSALPLLLSTNPQMNMTDAFFEAVSGLTTTGATVLTGLDAMPRSILYYRAQLHWLGGMGIIVLAVAILPMLGVGGMQLYRAETPGPMKESKLTPRITETAKALWLVYVGLSALCIVAFWLSGMSLFDAVCHAFATLATGGFSTHDASLTWFHSPLIETVATVFMFVSGVNFTLHFVAWRGRSLRCYWTDPEFRGYCLIVLIVTAICAVTLIAVGRYPSVLEAVRLSAFHVVSFITTTGFATTAFDQWPGALPLMLILIGFFGGCAGSTAGGMKVVRWLLLYNQGIREVKRLVHPAAEIPIRLGDSVVPQQVVESVWGFSVMYICLFGVMLLILIGSGLDQVTAFSALATSMNNVGPGLGEVVSTFSTVNPLAKWVCSIAMLFGRLEVFTLLVLFSPAFWRS